MWTAMLDISLNLFSGVAILKIWFGDLCHSLRFFRFPRLKFFSKRILKFYLPFHFHFFTLLFVFSHECRVEFSINYRIDEITVNGMLNRVSRCLVFRCTLKKISKHKTMLFFSYFFWKILPFLFWHVALLTHSEFIITSNELIKNSLKSLSFNC